MSPSPGRSAVAASTVRRLRLAGLLLLAALAVLPLACSAGDTRADEGDAAGAAKGADPVATPGPAAAGEEAVPVEVATLGRGPIEAVLRFSTNLEAESQVGVYSQAAHKVLVLAVEEGDEVKKGDLLLRLQDDEQKTSLAKVESQLGKAQREYDRQKRLFADELISEQAMNDATYELEQLRLAREEAERQLSYTEVRAPISGVVTQRLVHLGDQVTVNQHLFDIVDFDSIVARVFVPEKELARLSVGLAARISSPALGGASFAGRVERIAPIVDPKSGTLKVTVAIPRTRRLLPGMYVDVALVTDVEENALLVPKRALVYDDDQVFLFRVGDDGRAERIVVRPRLEDKDNVLPEGGVAVGDRVVVAGQASLKDGSKVRLAGEKT